MIPEPLLTVLQALTVISFINFFLVVGFLTALAGSVRKDTDGSSLSGGASVANTGPGGLNRNVEKFADGMVSVTIVIAGGITWIHCIVAGGAVRIRKFFTFPRR